MNNNPLNKKLNCRYQKNVECPLMRFRRNIYLMWKICKIMKCGCLLFISWVTYEWLINDFLKTFHKDVTISFGMTGTKLKFEAHSFSHIFGDKWKHSTFGYHQHILPCINKWRARREMGKLMEWIEFLDHRHQTR